MEVWFFMSFCFLEGYIRGWNIEVLVLRVVKGIGGGREGFVMGRMIGRICYYSRGMGIRL